MPKLKTHKGAAKRFRVRGSVENPFKCKSAFRNHILTKKSTKRKRHLRVDAQIQKCDQLTIHRMLHV